MWCIKPSLSPRSESSASRASDSCVTDKAASSTSGHTPAERAQIHDQPLITRTSTGPFAILRRNRCKTPGVSTMATKMAGILTGRRWKRFQTAAFTPIAVVRSELRIRIPEGISPWLLSPF